MSVRNARKTRIVKYNVTEAHVCQGRKYEEARKFRSADSALADEGWGELGRVWSLATVSVGGESGSERVRPVKRSIGPRWQSADVRRPTTLYEKGTVKPHAGVAYLKPFGTIEESDHPTVLLGTS